MAFDKVQQAYDHEQIRRFWQEIWRDGKGAGYLCYYTRFDV